MRHTISVLVRNEFGVLSRVAGMFSGRGYNIDSLNVAPTLDESVSHITLTTEGRSLATTVVRRHRLAERFMTDILQLGWADAHQEAGRWEHVISPTVEAAMMRVLDDPTTCPHGNPIPGTGYSRPATARPLAELDAEEEFTVVRIPEELEFQEGQLDYLEGAGLVPGRVGRVLSVAPDGTTTVSVDDVPVGISGFTAERIVVSDVVVS